MSSEKKEKKNLSEQGILFLTGNVDKSSTSRLIENIIQANMDQKQDFLQLMISSPGGSVDDGFALIDIMNWSRLPIYTTGFGLIASMGLAVMMAGEPGHRVLTPRATLMSHRFWAMSIENYSGLVAKRKVEDLTHQRIVNHYLECSNFKTAEDVEKIALRDVDTWLTPEEALEFGFVDTVDSAGRQKSDKAA